MVEYIIPDVTKGDGTIVINDVVYNIFLEWNEIAQFWVFEMRDSDRNVVIGRTKLVPWQIIGRVFGDYNKCGLLYVVASGDELDRNCFVNKTARFLYRPFWARSGK